MNYSTSDYLEQLEQDREDLVDNLETKGITGLTGDETFTELVPEVLNIPSGGGTVEAEYKDVNFYDYDGTRVYSYTKNDFLNLSSMPENPSHDGLIAQGWNWTLSDAKTFVTNNDKLDIGQYYVTDNGKTRIYIELTDGALSPYCGFAINGTATIEWGDGTSDTVMGSSTSTAVNTQHTYASAGKYVISISSNSKIYILAGGGISYLCWDNNTTSITTGTGSKNIIYTSAVYKIELGSNVEIGSRCFGYLTNLQLFTLPNNTSMTSLPFFNNYALRYILFPNTSISNIDLSTSLQNLEKIVFPPFNSAKIVQLGSMPIKDLVLVNYSFSYNMALYVGFNLRKLTIDSTSTRIPQNCISGLRAVSHIKFPKTITEIDTYAMTTSVGIKYYDFSKHEAIPTLGNAEAFPTGKVPELKIIVPDSLYEDWIVASNWSDLSSYIISKSDWDNL